MSSIPARVSLRDDVSGENQYMFSKHRSFPQLEGMCVPYSVRSAYEYMKFKMKGIHFPTYISLFHAAKETSSTAKNRQTKLGVTFSEVNEALPPHFQLKRISSDVNAWRQYLANKIPVIVGMSISPLMNKWFQMSSWQQYNASKYVLPVHDCIIVNGERQKKEDVEFVYFHCFLLVGYDDQSEVFIAENTWGPGWGNHGTFYLPYHYVDNSTNDCLYVQSVILTYHPSA